VDYLLFVAGLVLLLWGGDRMVAGAVRLSAHLRLSPLAISIVVVGLGTSLPELVTSLTAALQGSPGVAIGNVVGSNIANICLVLGVGALMMPLDVREDPTHRDLMCLLVAGAMTLFVLSMPTVERWMGLVFIAALAAYLTVVLVSARRAHTLARAAETDEPASSPASSPGATLGRESLMTAVGMVTLVVGADLLVSGALGIARAFAVPESVIGLTLLALGTSLPELATTIIAVRKGEVDVAVGNVVGSTLFNLLGILGVTAAVTPLLVPPDIASFDVWVMCVAIITLVVFAWSGSRVTRTEGALLVAAYPVYLYTFF
jgi:cation:H+ antiporter